jgi:hypothetical protein
MLRPGLFRDDRWFATPASSGYGSRPPIGLPPLSAWAEFTITVTPHAHAWQNAELAADVDGNGTVTPLDVLLVINWINTSSSGPVPSTPPDWTSGSCLFVDVSGDEFVSPIDVLLAINYLNGWSSSTFQIAEGEGITASTTYNLRRGQYPDFTGLNDNDFASPIDNAPVVSDIRGPSSSVLPVAEIQGIAAATVPNATSASYVGSTVRQRLPSPATDQAFIAESGFSLPADWDELLDVLARA